MTAHRRLVRSGFTLIEMLVVLFVIGLLLAFLIPAVQAAREAARRAQCANNLHQLGVAVHAYVSNFGALPDDHGGVFFSGSGFSLFAKILPMLEEQAIYNQFNYVPLGSISGSGPTSNDPHRTVQAVWLATLLCPSDPLASPGRLFLGQMARTSYAGSVGYDTSATSGPNSANSTGVIGLGNARSNDFATIPDGLSATMLISEWNLSSPDFQDNTPSRATFSTADYALPGEYDMFIAACRDLNPLDSPLGPPQLQAWIADGIGHSLLTSDLSPNGHTCIDYQLPVMSTAGSGHRGRTNVLFCDGHVQTVSNSVNLPIWRALSTRAGAEIFDSSSY